MSQPIRVMIVDDQPIIRAAVHRHLSDVETIDVVAEFDNGHDAIKGGLELQPDVVILDIRMSGKNGIDVAHQLCRLKPKIKVIILSSLVSDFFIFRLIKYGVTGYITKRSGAGDLVEAIQEVANNGVYYSEEVKERIHNRIQRSEFSTPFDVLTDKEVDVLDMYLHGATTEQISESLRVDPKTIYTHRANLLKKMHVKLLEELYPLAIEHGFLERL